MNLNFRQLLCFAAVALTGLCFAEEYQSETGLLFAGHFENAEVTSDVRGSRKSKLAAAYTWRYGVRLFTEKSWEESGLTWEDFSERAGRIADKIAGEIKPEYVRDRNGVIDYAVIAGSNVFFSSSITSPVFVNHFVDTLGDKLHVIIIDRNILYVFPATGGKLAEFSPSLVETFESTPMPVSLEVFEVDKTGYRVVGEIERSAKPVEFGPLKDYKLE